LATKEYADESTRGESQLTINPDGSAKEATSGLSRDYITEYSYGILESFNLYIPKFMGGGNSEDVGKDSETYKAYINLGASPIEALNGARNAPMYWGDQTIVVPLYNKFRAVSSIQVILELCIPVLGIFALVRLFNDFQKDEEKLKALKYSVIITAGLALVFLLGKSFLFDFESFRDDGYIEAYGQPFIDAVIEDRKSLMTSDTIRTLILVLLSAGTVYFFIKKKLSENITVVVFAVLLLFDLISVDRQYVNNDSFTSALSVDKPYNANEADKEILKDKAHFRVLDMSSDGQRKPGRAAR